MNSFRYGNIVYYFDIPECGYPILLQPKFWSEDRMKNLSFDTPVKNDGEKNHWIRPMLFNFDDFWAENAHLKIRQEELPKEIIALHDFQNWYEDKFGYQPKILRGGKIMNQWT